LRLSGANFETNLEEIVSISYGSTNCVLDEDSLTASSVDCDLEDDLVAGEIKPVFKTSMGDTYVSASAVTIEPTLSSVSPMTDINPLGGNTLTFTGTGFPHTINDFDTLDVLLDNDSGESDSVACTIVTTSNTEVTCVTQMFDKMNVGVVYVPTLTING